MPEVTPDPAPEPAAATPEPTPSPKPAPPAEPTPKPNVWDDPAAAKAEIEKLRRENGTERVNAKAQAAEEARKELAQSIGKAIGLVDDDPDPAQLAEQAAAFQADAQQSRVELAVWRAAAQAGGDPAALLDSSSFLASLGNIDPTDGESVAAAIKSAVEKNPRLAADTGPRLPAPNPAIGSSGGGAPDLSMQIDAAQKAGNITEVIRLQNQKLAAQKP